MEQNQSKNQSINEPIEEYIGCPMIVDDFFSVVYPPGKKMVL
jgi:hypothetical protein